jgi:hypothetical protein
MKIEEFRRISKNLIKLLIFEFSSSYLAWGLEFGDLQGRSPEMGWNMVQAWTKHGFDQRIRFADPLKCEE